MADAVFEVYDDSGNLVLSTANRVLRVLSASDASPSSNSFSSNEISTASAVPDGRGRATVSSGSITYAEGGTKRSVILY